MQRLRRMVKGWGKHGRSQAIPTFHPYKGYEGWSKGGVSVGEARQFPPFAHTKGMKDGERVDEAWEKPGNSHPSPMQRVRRVGKEWSKGGNRQRRPTLHPYKRQEKWSKPVPSPSPIPTKKHPLTIKRVSNQYLIKHSEIGRLFLHQANCRQRRSQIRRSGR